jgi:hypothetical protein
MPFVKGQSGNPEGRTSALPPRPFEAALKRALIQENSHRLRKMAEQVLDLAAEGEQWAVIFVADRLDGKPRQAVPTKDEEGNPVMVGSITYHIVDATKPTDRSREPASVTPLRAVGGGKG